MTLSWLEPHLNMHCSPPQPLKPLMSCVAHAPRTPFPPSAHAQLDFKRELSAAAIQRAWRKTRKQWRHLYQVPE